MASNSTPRARLKFGVEVYNPYSLKSLPVSDVKKEYSRLRSIAAKRIKRLEASEWADSRTVAKLPKLAKVSELSESQLLARTADLAMFITGPASSVSGLNRMRRQAVATLSRRYPQLSGVVTVENWRKFGEFMERMRLLHLDRLYDSERVLEFFAENPQKNIAELVKDFEKWMEEDAKSAGKLVARSRTGADVYRETL